jgi:hypothetical protein
MMILESILKIVEAVLNLLWDKFETRFSPFEYQTLVPFVAQKETLS